jgi:hypothetical protein
VRRLRHPIATWRTWRRKKHLIVNSQVNVYASRKHLLPLEQCTKEQLEAAVRHNERERKRYAKAYERNHRQNYDALETWHRLCQNPLRELISLVGEGKVMDVPWKKRRKPVEELMRIRKLD